MKNTLFIAFGVALLLLQSGLSVVLPLHPAVPLVLLPMALYLGVTPDVQLLRGAVLSFGLGVIADEVSGTPLGVQTFVLVATFMLSRVAGLRLFLRGVAFQMVATFGISLVASGSMLALTAIFEPSTAFPEETFPAGFVGDVMALAWGGEDRVPLVGGPIRVTTNLVATAFATGLVAPAIYIVVRRLDALNVRRRRGSEAVA